MATTVFQLQTFLLPTLPTDDIYVGIEKAFQISLLCAMFLKALFKIFKNKTKLLRIEKTTNIRNYIKKYNVIYNNIFGK